MQKCAEMSAESTKTTRSSAKKPRFGRVANPNIGRRTGIDVIAGKTIRKGPDGLERFSDYWTDSELDDTGKVQPIATSSPHKKAITGNRVKTTQILVGELVDNLKKSSNVESAKSPSPKTAEARSRLEENANRTPQKSATQSRFSFSGNASAANAQTPKKKSILFAALEELALSRNVSMGATAPKIPDEKDDDLGDFSDSSSSDGIVLLSGKPDDKINGATDATSPRRSPRRSDKINGATDATSLRRSPRRSDKINGATDATSLRRSPRRSDTPKNLAAQLANAFKESQAIQNNEPEPSTSKGLPVAKSKVFRSKVPVPIKPGQRSIRKSNKTVEEQEENGPKIVDVVSLTSRNSASPRHPTTVTENEVAQQSPLRNLSFDVDVKSPEKAADPHFRTTEDVPDEEESRVLRSSPENNVASGKQQSPMKETPVKSRKRALDTAAASDDVESLKKPATSKSTKKKSTKPASKKRQPKSQQSSQKTTVVKTGPRRPLPKGKVVSPKKVGSTATKKLIANSAPPEPTPGVRRSQRNRFRRLDFRYNERIVYEHTASGEVRAIGIESESLPERKLRQEHSPEDVSMENISSTTVLSPQGNHEISKRVLHTKNSLEWRGPSGAVAKKKDPYSITKFNDSTAYSQGFLKIMPLEEKPLQMNSTHEMMFTVFQGKVKVQVNRTVFRLGKGDSFEIPKGNIYSIKNMQNGEANLVFSMVRSSLLDDTF